MKSLVGDGFNLVSQKKKQKPQTASTQLSQVLQSTLEDFDALPLLLEADVSYGFACIL